MSSAPATRLRRPPRPRAALARRTALGASLLVAAGVLGACGGAATGPDEPAGTVVEVAAVDFAFEPSTIEVTPGRVTFRVENRGAEEHEFEIFAGDTVVDEVEGLVPGLTRDLTVTLDAGTYTFVCKLADHEQRGMSGTLTVAP